MPSRKPKSNAKLPGGLAGKGTPSGRLNWIEVTWSAICELPVLLASFVLGACHQIQDSLPWMFLYFPFQTAAIIAAITFLVLFLHKVFELRRADNAGRK